jgi:hypothetical protein
LVFVYEQLKRQNASAGRGATSAAAATNATSAAIRTARRRNGFVSVCPSGACGLEHDVRAAVN